MENQDKETRRIAFKQKIKLFVGLVGVVILITLLSSTYFYVGKQFFKDMRQIVGEMQEQRKEQKLGSVDWG